jgi:hypothetical protein
MSKNDKPYQAVRYLKIAARHYNKLVPTVDFGTELPVGKDKRHASSTIQHLP